ncbi:hypothetical protein [Leptospira levettii]|uniref:Uncharacterized protein n=1 Tax=Leptospira levettii TaxID=2023178 RepID=A0AAW5VGY0_9LEPT|nr:hypothetical protein [Leptospira levettii]MCW7512094.1 hypothetical protein [Leptospira levettii]MCW7517167.1 hypothetical protein [Leptospira levettii]
MKKDLTESQRTIYIKIKELLDKYPKPEFSKRMIYIEEPEFLELSNLMQDIGDGNHLIPKTKLFVKKLLDEWQSLFESLQSANKDRIAEELNPSINDNGFGFSSMSILYELGCTFFRNKLQEYTDFIEKKYEIEKQPD